MGLDNITLFSLHCIGFFEVYIYIYICILAENFQAMAEKRKRWQGRPSAARWNKSGIRLSRIKAAFSRPHRTKVHIHRSNIRGATTSCSIHSSTYASQYCDCQKVPEERSESDARNIDATQSRLSAVVSSCFAISGAEGMISYNICIPKGPRCSQKGATSNQNGD